MWRRKSGEFQIHCHRPLSGTGADLFFLPAEFCARAGANLCPHIGRSTTRHEGLERHLLGTAGDQAGVGRGHVTAPGRRADSNGTHISILVNT